MAFGTSLGRDTGITHSYSSCKKRCGKVLEASSDGRVRIQMGAHSIVTLRASQLHIAQKRETVLSEGRGSDKVNSRMHLEDEKRIDEFFARLDGEITELAESLKLEASSLGKLTAADNVNLSKESACWEHTEMQIMNKEFSSPLRESVFTALPRHLLAHNVLMNYLYTDFRSAVGILATCRQGQSLRHDGLWEKALINWSAFSRHLYNHHSPIIRIHPSRVLGSGPLEFCSKTKVQQITTNKEQCMDEPHQSSVLRNVMENASYSSVATKNEAVMSAAFIVASSLQRASNGDTMAALFRDRLTFAIISLIVKSKASFAALNEKTNRYGIDVDVNVGGSFAVREYMLRSAIKDPDMASQAAWQPGDLDIFVHLSKGSAKLCPFSFRDRLKDFVEDVIKKISQQLGDLCALFPKALAGHNHNNGNILDDPLQHLLYQRPVVSFKVPGIGKIDFVGCEEHSSTADQISAFDLSICQISATPIPGEDTPSRNDKCHVPVLEFDMTQRAQNDIAKGTMTSTGKGRFSYKRIVKYINRGFQYREVRPQDCVPENEIMTAADWSEHGPNNLAKLYFGPASQSPFDSEGADMLKLLDNCVSALPIVCLLPNKFGSGTRGMRAVPLFCYDPATCADQMKTRLIRWVSKCIAKRDGILSLAEVESERKHQGDTEQELKRIRYLKLRETTVKHFYPNNKRDICMPFIIQRLYDLLADPVTFSAEVHSILESEALPGDLMMPPANQCIRNTTTTICHNRKSTVISHAMLIDDNAIHRILESGNNRSKQLSEVLQLLDLEYNALYALEERLRTNGINYIEDLLKLGDTMMTKYFPYRRKLHALASWAKNNRNMLIQKGNPYAPSLIGEKNHPIDFMLFLCELETIEPLIAINCNNGRNKF